MRRTYGGGLFGSSDGGRSWRALGPPGVVYVQALAIAPGDPAIVYAGVIGVDARGLYKSTDGGSSWQRLTDALSSTVDAIALDPENPATVYIGTPGGEGGVFKSTDGGTSWQPAELGAARLRVKRDGRDIDRPRDRPRTPHHALRRHRPARGVYRSTDAGSSWQPLNAGLTVLDVRALALDATGQTLYAGTSGGGVVSLHVRTN